MEERIYRQLENNLEDIKAKYDLGLKTPYEVIGEVMSAYDDLKEYKISSDIMMKRNNLTQNFVNHELVRLMGGAHNMVNAEVLNAYETYLNKQCMISFIDRLIDIWQDSDNADMQRYGRLFEARWFNVLEGFAEIIMSGVILKVSEKA